MLLEGGGRIDGAFLQAGVVDEINLLPAPAIGGGSGSPAIFEAGEKGLGGRAKLELKSARPVAGGAVHLRYRVVTA
ncbi:MAG: dihydrofolate reductase family protein [Janthinobacterium lividum]